MAKETFYFSHDYNARSDQKIMSLLARHGMSGYGIYWSIVEDLYNNANALRSDCDGIAYHLRVDTSVVKSILHDFDLFEHDGEMFGSLSVEKRMNARSEKSAKARESASKRWEECKRNADAMRSHSDGNAIKESKVKEKKGKESKDSSGKPDGITKLFLDVYNHHLEKQTGTTEQFSVAGRSALSKTIKHLTAQVEKKHQGAGPEKIQEETLNAWKWIWHHFDQWDDFQKRNLKLEQVNSNLVNIISVIKNPKKNGSKQQFNAGAVAAEVLTDIGRRYGQPGETDQHTAEG